MSQISINNLTFNYNNSGDDIFKDMSLTLDTDWKLGLIGRNGRGKTTLLKILSGELIASGQIISSVEFGYFPINISNKTALTIKVVKDAIAPYSAWESEMEIYSTDETKINEYGDILEKYLEHDGYTIEEQIKKEVNLIGLDTVLLDREFNTLSFGEQTKMQLVALFLRKNHFLLIDEPTNHLDVEGRDIVAKYLSNKKGFILVSHDRLFVDNVCDHIMSINRADIEVQRGNYSTWLENKYRQDNFEIAENEKLKKDIDRLKKTAKEKANWSDKIEASKFGSGVLDRGFVGHKSAKMMKRAKSIESRQNKAIEEKSKLLKNIEREDTLSLNKVEAIKECVLSVKDLTISYGEKTLFKPLSFDVNNGECLCIKGTNGSGKSSILKLLLGETIAYKGTIISTKNISYVSQDITHLKGTLNDFVFSNNINGEILRNNLRKLGFERDLFNKNIEGWSEGQKKKLLLAKSLSDSAELYIWDEPLNFIDIITRSQIESLIKSIKPTMIIVEHDSFFVDNVATKIINIETNS